MRNRWIVMFFVLSLAINASVLAAVGYNFYANRHRGATTAGHLHDRKHHFYEVLELTPGQLEKMIPMAASFHERFESLHADMAKKKEALTNLLRGESVAPTQIEALRKKMAAIQDNIQKAVIAHVLDVKEILDPSQQRRFFDLIDRSMTRDQGMFVRAGED
jgi:Spy/CpxP family protein refolding chaperone